ncbi:MAG: 50S ribosomal protein L4 [Candidatus Micrarchaeota archaeon]|nr:50S ribosomal protein L4 [Candidatus Micrarchaeota archaeon]
MKSNVYSLDGKIVGEIELPEVFSTQVNLGLVARAAIADQTKHYQPKGNYIYAGMETSARYRGRKGDFGSGKNRGIAIRPREVLPKGRLGRVKRIPSAVKGRRAHPPKVEKKIVERINKKEYAAALRCAIAATARKDLVTGHGHRLSDGILLPIVITDSFEQLSKTSDVQKVLSLLIAEDLKKAKKPKARSGVRARKGGKKYPKSAIIAVSSQNAPVIKAARNIAGVDVVPASDLKVELLAPGAKAGRLAIYTQSALKVLSAM